MSKNKYNYFDDEAENNEYAQADNSSAKNNNTVSHKKANKSNAFSKPINFIKDHFYTPQELSAYPNLRRFIFKWIIVAAVILVLLECAIVFAHSINSQKQKNDLFCKDAGSVCTDYIAEYGACSWDRLDEKYGENLASMSGLSYARRMDFDGDGKDELMACYLDSGVYHIEIWGYEGKDFIRLYSHMASSDQNDITLGSWIAFYHKHGVYYVCQSESTDPEKVELYKLEGNEFKKSNKTVTYNKDTSVYTVNDKKDIQNFERIQLSFIRRSKAGLISDTVTNNLSEFETKTVSQIDEKKTDAQLKAEAYYNVIEKYNTKYGYAQYKRTNGYSYIDGLAIADLIDFDGDGNDELFLVYRKDIKKRKKDTYNNNYVAIVESVYFAEVYSWNGTKAISVFTKEGISTLFKDFEDPDSDDRTHFIIMKKDGAKTYFCNNTYSYTSKSVYSASSRMYALNKKGEFETKYNAKMEYEYGYKDYYIDGEKVYRTSFELNGYEIPYFCNEDSYNENEYNITYLSAKNSYSDEVNERVQQTVKNIKTLNNKYSPDEE